MKRLLRSRNCPASKLESLPSSLKRNYHLQNISKEVSLVKWSSLLVYTINVLPYGTKAVPNKSDGHAPVTLSTLLSNSLKYVTFFGSFGNCQLWNTSLVNMYIPPLYKNELKSIGLLEFHNIKFFGKYILGWGKIVAITKCPIKNNG